MNLCPFCMKEVQDVQCPHCGNPVSYSGDPMHLQPGYVLNGKHPYILGAALGQGGFGITYIALDMVTRERVAIKEYFPTYCAGRTDKVNVTSYRGQEEVFQKGRERFLDEARVLKSLSDLNSIVNVLDFFEFNNSAYLVMEFLEGDSLKSHAMKNGRFPAQEFLGKLRPLMEDLERMHQRGVVHRDIAPDNIILMPDGQMKLIDFGAARSYVGDKSMTVVVKKGFAPIEQYMRHGSTAATDVYALAATIYYCITGIVPPDSAERQYDEEMLQSPVSLGVELSRSQERAILNALEVQPKKRTQSILELCNGLCAMFEEEERRRQEDLCQQEEYRKKEEQQKQKEYHIIPRLLICVMVVSVLIYLFMNQKCLIMGHKWQTATCTTAQICEVCSEVDGEALGHIWNEATCTKAKSCKACDAAAGLPLGHDWKDATCVEPKTCTLCSAVEGTAIGHSWTTIKKLENCSVCNQPNGRIVQVNADLLASTWTEDTMDFKLNNGKTVGGNIITMNSIITECYSVTLCLQIDQVIEGNILGEWGFYIRDLEGNWHLADTFELNGKYAEAHFDFTEPISFDAWICPCHVLGDSWNFYFYAWLKDATVFEYTG